MGFVDAAYLKEQIRQRAKGECAWCKNFNHCNTSSSARKGNHRYCWVPEEFPLTDFSTEKQGRWELFGHDDSLGCAYFCSNCQWSIDEEEFYDGYDYKPYKFCPNCGANMME